MKKILTQDDFITAIATKAGFTKSDVKVILDTIVEFFTDCVRQDITLKLRSFGKLETRIIKARLGRNGESLPATTKVIFRLAENIRNVNKIKQEV